MIGHSVISISTDLLLGIWLWHTRTGNGQSGGKDKTERTEKTHDNIIYCNYVIR